MKKQIAIAILLLAIKLPSISQTSNDSVTCIPNSQLKKAISQIELGKVFKEEAELGRTKIATLEGYVKNRELIIREFQRKDSIASNVISSYEQAVINFQSQLKNAEMMNKIQKKVINRQKFRKILALGIGFGAGFLIFN